MPAIRGAVLMLDVISLTIRDQSFPSMDSSAERSDYTHLVSVGSLLDEGHNVFLVESGAKAKLIYGLNNDLSHVREVVIKRGEFQAVVTDATGKWQSQ